MGSSFSNNNQKYTFNVNDWKEIPLVSFTNNVDPYYSARFKVMAHKSNAALETEKYDLLFNSQAEFISYLQSYYERKKYPNLVTSIHIEQTTKKSMCSTFHSASVYLQRIPIRLSQIVEMPLGEGLYAIEASLEGYEKMFEKTGYFEVSSDMIGINRQGKVKVWTNRNFSKNFPEFNKIDHNKGEVDFVMRLIHTIEEEIDYDCHRLKFSQYFAKTKPQISFASAKSCLKQYCQYIKVAPQKLVKSILVVFKNDSSTPKSVEALTFFKSSNYSGKQKEDKNRSSKLEFTKKKYRKSMINLPEPNSEFKKIQLQETGTNNTIHQSFIKSKPKMLELEDFPTPKYLAKTGTKIPSVSFCYKSSGLYSPQNQNIDAREWFSSTKTTEPQFKIKKKQAQSPMAIERSNNFEQRQKKLKCYYSNGDTYNIDPDIARDLEEMKF